MTKKQAIDGHRRMWKGIAERVRETQSYVYKFEYGRDCMPEILAYENYQHICQWVAERGLTCAECPLEWRDSKKPVNKLTRRRGRSRGTPSVLTCHNGAFGRYANATDWQKAETAALETALRPEKGGDEDVLS